MKFEIHRELKNKHFISTVKRVIVADDPNMEEEARLQNDFGAVEIDAGGTFLGYVKKEDDKYTVSLETVEESFPLKFALYKNVLSLADNVEIKFDCDSTREADFIADDKKTVIPALKMAELKCEIFELVIEKRIEQAVENWKKQKTDFQATLMRF